MVTPRLFQRENGRLFHQASKGEIAIVKCRGKQCIFHLETGIEQLCTFSSYLNTFFSGKQGVMPEVRGTLIITF
jgi:hypothetical protein